MKYLIVFCFLSISIVTAAQSPVQKTCSAPEASQFDFWIGDWDLTWNDTLHGTNKVVKLFGNCTVHENFTDPRLNFLGQSWSVYNANYKQWQQTWIDNNGGYITLTGGKVGDSMILTTAERNVPVAISSSGKIMSRMVYHNIQKDSFDWSWEASNDGGKTWSPKWRIHYDRKK